MAKKEIANNFEYPNIEKNEKMSKMEIEAKFERLDREDVVSVPSGPMILTNRTFTVSELITAMLPIIKEKTINTQGWPPQKERWFHEGIDCKMLQPGKSWQKGKVRITLEFCPETLEAEETPAIEPAAGEESSPLDEIRQMKI